MSEIRIRNITDSDLRAVELVTKRAFWNLNMPGCDEHYLVHRLWDNDACVKPLSLLAEADGHIVGGILYAKARLQTAQGNVEVLTFGPLCVEPAMQKRGIGGLLLKTSMALAAELGYRAIFICGVPTYYPRFGFQTADHFGVTLPDGSNFDAFMGITLTKGGLSGIRGKFYDPEVYDCDIHDPAYMARVDAFDAGFPYMEKKVLPHQWR